MIFFSLRIFKLLIRCWMWQMQEECKCICYLGISVWRTALLPRPSILSFPQAITLTVSGIESILRAIFWTQQGLGIFWSMGRTCLLQCNTYDTLFLASVFFTVFFLNLILFPNHINMSSLSQSLFRKQAFYCTVFTWSVLVLLGLSYQIPVWLPELGTRDNCCDNLKPPCIR